MFKRIAFWLSPELKTISDEMDFQIRKNNALRDLNKDLHGQCQMLRAARLVTEDERKGMERIVMEHTELFNQQNNVILWLRDNRPQVFKNKQYAGMSFSDMVINLLGDGQ